MTDITRPKHRCIDGWIPAGFAAKACECNHSVHGADRTQTDPEFVKMIVGAAVNWPSTAYPPTDGRRVVVDSSNVDGALHQITEPPDLADPATLGRMLHLVREAWAPNIVVLGGWRAVHIYAPTAGRQWVEGDLAPYLWESDALGEAEALVAALEAAPGRNRYTLGGHLDQEWYIDTRIETKKLRARAAKTVRSKRKKE